MDVYVQFSPSPEGQWQLDEQLANGICMRIKTYVMNWSWYEERRQFNADQL